MEYLVCKELSLKLSCLWPAEWPHRAGGSVLSYLSTTLLDQLAQAPWSNGVARLLRLLRQGRYWFHRRFLRRIPWELHPHSTFVRLHV